jgi:hypothetical protein
VFDTGRLLKPLKDWRFSSGAITRLRAANRNALVIMDEFKSEMASRTLSETEKFDFNVRYLEECMLDLTAEQIATEPAEELEIAVSYCNRQLDETIARMDAFEAALAGTNGDGPEGNGTAATTAASASGTTTTRSRSARRSPSGKGEASAMSSSSPTTGP